MATALKRHSAHLGAERGDGGRAAYGGITARPVTAWVRLLAAALPALLLAVLLADAHPAMADHRPVVVSTRSSRAALYASRFVGQGSVAEQAGRLYELTVVWEGIRRGMTPEEASLAAREARQLILDASTGPWQRFDATLEENLAYFDIAASAAPWSKVTFGSVARAAVGAMRLGFEAMGPGLDELADRERVVLGPSVVQQFSHRPDVAVRAASRMSEELLAIEGGAEAVNRVFGDRLGVRLGDDPMALIAADPVLRVLFELGGLEANAEGVTGDVHDMWAALSAQLDGLALDVGAQGEILTAMSEALDDLVAWVDQEDARRVWEEARAAQRAAHEARVGLARSAVGLFGTLLGYGDPVLAQRVSVTAGTVIDIWDGIARYTLGRGTASGLLSSVGGLTLTFNVATAVLNLAGFLAGGPGPSPELAAIQQVFEFLVELRTEMHSRFDRLESILDHVIASLDHLSLEMGRLRGDIEQVAGRLDEAVSAVHLLGSHLTLILASEAREELIAPVMAALDHEQLFGRTLGREEFEDALFDASRFATTRAGSATFTGGDNRARPTGLAAVPGQLAEIGDLYASLTYLERAAADRLGLVATGRAVIPNPSDVVLGAAATAALMEAHPTLAALVPPVLVDNALAALDDLQAVVGHLADRRLSQRALEVWVAASGRLVHDARSVVKTEADALGLGPVDPWAPAGPEQPLAAPALSVDACDQRPLLVTEPARLTPEVVERLVPPAARTAAALRVVTLEGCYRWSWAAPVPVSDRQVTGERRFVVEPAARTPDGKRLVVATLTAVPTRVVCRPDLLIRNCHAQSLDWLNADRADTTGRKTTLNPVGFTSSSFRLNNDGGHTQVMASLRSGAATQGSGLATVTALVTERLAGLRRHLSSYVADRWTHELAGAAADQKGAAELLGALVRAGMPAAVGRDDVLANLVGRDAGLGALPAGDYPGGLDPDRHPADQLAAAHSAWAETTATVLGPWWAVASVGGSGWWPELEQVELRLRAARTAVWSPVVAFERIHTTVEVSSGKTVTVPLVLQNLAVVPVTVSGLLDGSPCGRIEAGGSCTMSVTVRGATVPGRQAVAVEVRASSHPMGRTVAAAADIVVVTTA